MATRGFFGFVADQSEKIAYIHDDSYPAGVGLDVLAWLRTAMRSPDRLRERVAALRVLSPDSTPTDADIERLGKYADTSRIGHWWQLLWQTQGDPEAILEAGVIEDSSDFPADSSNCEWGYVADLDTMVFEVYRGQQDQPHNRGRFVAGQDPHEEWPAALVTGWRLDQLPSDDEFLDTLATAG